MVKPLALTLGEPAGIGPDITLLSWLRRREVALQPFYVIGDASMLARRARQLGIDVAIAEVEPHQSATAFDAALPVVGGGFVVTAEAGRPDASSAAAAI